MLEKISQVAEHVASHVSRREFVGRLGRVAAGVAAVLGGWLLANGDAQAAKAAGRHCHGQTCPAGYLYCCKEYDIVCRCNVWYCSTSPC